MIFSEFKKNMYNFSNVPDLGEVSADFTFPGNFKGFFGHFPGNPILPGICQIQCVLSLLSEDSGKTIQLSSVSRAKFLNIVKPDETISVKGKYIKSKSLISGSFTITKIISGKSVNVSKISIEAVI